MRFASLVEAFAVFGIRPRDINDSDRRDFQIDATTPFVRWALFVICCMWFITYSTQFLHVVRLRRTWNSGEEDNNTAFEKAILSKTEAFFP